MRPALNPSSQPAPASGTQEYGDLRMRVLDALLLDRSATVPSQALATLMPWAEATIASGQGPLRGMCDASVPPSWRDYLTWAGMPMSLHGPLHWDVDVIEVPAMSAPDIDGQVLRLPSPERLGGLTSLALKPFRMFLHQRLGCRLQTALGLHVYLWSNQALLVCCAPAPIGGFFYGPEVGHRASVLVMPGEVQLISWPAIG
jgi:hypothetical protein